MLGLCCGLLLGQLWPKSAVEDFPSFLGSQARNLEYMENLGEIRSFLGLSLQSLWESQDFSVNPIVLENHL